MASDLPAAGGAARELAPAAPEGAAAPAPTSKRPEQAPPAGLSLANLRYTLNQPAVRKTIPAIIVLLTLVLFGLMYAWMLGPSYRTLFPGMIEADQLEAMEILQTSGFRPRLDPQTGQLRVPSDRYHEARILLASRGLPKSGTPGGGIEALGEQSSMTTSQFMEQVRYTNAMEQELARSVMQIHTVQSARVHLATPRQSLFVRDRTPPSASVVITPQPGRVLSPDQVQAIVHLVSSSVPLLTPDNISVVDQLGNLLTDPVGQGAMSLSAAQLQHRMRIEETYRSRVLQVLGPILGDHNVRSQVNIDMDFTVVETTVEDYDTGNRGPRTRSEVLAEERSARLDARGVPGALANEPPDDPAFAAEGRAGEDNGEAPREGTFSSRSTRNFEIDRTLRHVRNSVGTIDRVSVAVAINERMGMNEQGERSPVPYSDLELERLTLLVQGVVGFDQGRGDQVVLVPARFEAPLTVPPIPWYENETLIGHAKWLVLVLLFVLVLLLVIRPLIKHFLAPPTGEAARQAAIEAGGVSEEDLEAVGVTENDSLDDIKKKLRQHLASRNEEAQLDTLEAIKANLTPKKSSMAAEMLDTANSYDDKVALIRMLVREDSGRVANVFKTMIKGK